MNIDRRRLIQTLAAYVTASYAVQASGVSNGGDAIKLQKVIPSSGDMIPIVGLGSWITFNVGRDPRAIASVAQVMETFFARGGRMIDSSPMYGSSQAVIGKALRQLANPPELFSADKVWVDGEKSGRAQIKESLSKWQIPRFNLMQVHNLRDWEIHLNTLFAMKEQGKLQYVGITTSHGRRHSDIEHILERYSVDFLQLTYNLTHREAEKRLLPLAKERGVAVIANRPFDGGQLVRALKRYSFPEWAVAAGFSGWADFLLKFNASHPAIVCSIPATSQVRHVEENMLASWGSLPDAMLRRRMQVYVEEL